MDDSLIHIGTGIASALPATLLTKKICDALGGLWRPWQIRRVAKAEADAQIMKAEAGAESAEIEAQSKIEVEKLMRRAAHRFLAEETKKQLNMEAIEEKARKQLTNNAKPQDMEDDWIINFFEKCRLISDEKMQDLWARVLAGEANTPGKFSKRTVNCVASMGKSDAEAFSKLCGFGWYIDDGVTPLGVYPLIYNPNDDYYKHHQLTFDFLIHLSDAGLIRVDFNPIATFGVSPGPTPLKVSYFGTDLLIHLASEEVFFSVGRVLLTNVGQELAPICGAQAIEGFLDYILEDWQRRGIAVSSPWPRTPRQGSALLVSTYAHH